MYSTYPVTAGMGLEPGCIHSFSHAYYPLANFVSYTMDSSYLAYCRVTDPDPKDNDVESVT
jgi:hypothetical protein